MICSICNKQVVLIPSAAERAIKFGGKASDYIALFPNHQKCVSDKRDQSAIDLIKQKNKL